MRRPANVLAFSLLLVHVVPCQGLYVGPGEPAPQQALPPQATAAPAPGIRLTQLHVRATVVDGAASTELHQTFRNDTPRVAEGEWILPLPAGATADRFTMTVNGKETSAEVLDSNRARDIYTSIVRRERDPGLLEYLGAGCLRARIFPIPARGEIDVRVRYRHVLPETAGLREWRFPLRSARAGSSSAEKVALDLTIRASRPIKNVFTPLPLADVRRNGEHEARVALELDAGQVIERDLVVFHGLSEHQFGLDLLAYRKAGEPGYFLMLCAPQQEWDAAQTLRKAITFVLDTSGSMQGKKLEQARAAVRFFVQSLQPKDWFNVVPFSTEARAFFPALVAASKENVDEALRKVEALAAVGGTNIQDALEQALAAPLPGAVGDVLPVTLFLTDGQPTVGNTSVDALLALARAKNAHRRRVFVLGVGHDVNTLLLDKLAADSGGCQATYVAEDENLELKTSALLTKLSHPVMSDVTLRCDGIDVLDVMPQRMPDLFQGSRVVVAGRYTGSGPHAVRLSGVVAGKRRELVFETTFPAQAEQHDFVPALWAERRVAVLLDAIRLNGQSKELREEVQRLGKQFGIVTPFTSHLIVEEAVRLGMAPRPERQYRGPVSGGASVPGPSGPSTSAPAAPAPSPRRLADLGRTHTGQQAVTDSLDIGAVSGADEFFLGGGNRAAGRTRRPSGPAPLTRRVKDRTFYLVDGVWVDARFQAAMQDKVRKVTAFSQEYFELLAKHPELAPFLSFATRVRLVFGDGAIEVM